MKLTKSEIIEELKGEVRVYRESYRERDGKVHNQAALRTIAALRQAIKTVQASKSNVWIGCKGKAKP